MSRSINLNHKTVLELLPAAPFNFDASLRKPDHFPFYIEAGASVQAASLARTWINAPHSKEGFH